MVSPMNFDALSPAVPKKSGSFTRREPIGLEGLNECHHPLCRASFGAATIPVRA